MAGIPETDSDENNQQKIEKPIDNGQGDTSSNATTKKGDGKSLNYAIFADVRTKVKSGSLFRSAV